MTDEVEAPFSVWLSIWVEVSDLVVDRSWVLVSDLNKGNDWVGSGNESKLIRVLMVLSNLKVRVSDVILI